MKNTKFTAAAYDFFMVGFEILLIRKWREKLWGRVKPPRILEAGVGTGLNIHYYRPNYLITALDSSEHFLDKARQRANNKQVKIEFVKGDVQNLPFSADIFDSAVSTFLFCQLSNPLQGLQEIHRVLKPGGRLLLLEHVRPQGRIEKLVSSISKPVYRIFGDHIARDTAQLTEKAGFSNVTSTPLFMSLVILIEAEKASFSAHDDKLCLGKKN